MERATEVGAKARPNLTEWRGCVAISRAADARPRMGEQRRCEGRTRTGSIRAVRRSLLCLPALGFVIACEVLDRRLPASGADGTDVLRPHASGDRTAFGRRGGRAPDDDGVLNVSHRAGISAGRLPQPALPPGCACLGVEERDVGLSIDERRVRRDAPTSVLRPGLRPDPRARRPPCVGA
jgi:hypothetical protein